MNFFTVFAVKPFYPKISLLAVFVEEYADQIADPLLLFLTVQRGLEQTHIEDRALLDPLGGQLGDRHRRSRCAVALAAIGR